MLETVMEESSEMLTELVDRASELGYLTTQDILQFFPQAEDSANLLDELFNFLYDAGVEIQLDEPDEAVDAAEHDGHKEREYKFGYAMFDLSQISVDDSVGLYLKEMASVPLLTTEEEIDLAKRYERGKQAAARLIAGGRLSGKSRESLEAEVADAKRTEQPLSKLLLAENCGGSDGNSGCTANPALGVASDELVKHGATSVLAETTEIYGAEHLLTNRAVSPEVAEKLMGQIRWWEDYARRHDSSIDNNPSVGNKEGGLTTIYEKSLGALAKGGQAPLMAVYDYAELIDTPGFGFMDTPGYDPVSMTGLVAGGCNVGVFTTGRGSVYGCKPAPCIKVATNTLLFNGMEEDMDLNAGTIIDGTETVAEVGARIFEKILAVASGEKTKSELNGIGDEEFQPWFPGPQY